MFSQAGQNCLLGILWGNRKSLLLGPATHAIREIGDDTVHFPSKKLLGNIQSVNLKSALALGEGMHNQKTYSPWLNRDS